MEFFERLKCFLRQNMIYKKYCQTYVNDCRYWFRNMKYYCSLYHWKKDKEINGHTVYFIIDKNISHPGLIDRVKAIVGTYYIAKQNGFDFKIIFTNPFFLTDYLTYSSQHWIASEDELSYSIKNTRLIAYNGGGKVPTLKKSVKQYHVYCYIGYDILCENKIENYHVLWKDLYFELFRPVLRLENALQEIGRILPENQFIAIHLRFVNALEKFEENQFNFLSQEQKEELILRCFNMIRDVMKKYPNKETVVFSDSAVFQKRVQKELPVTVLPGTIGHVSFTGYESVVLKAFIDFYTMSKAERIVRILGSPMYASAFSYYAAVLGGKECEDYHCS